LRTQFIPRHQGRKKRIMSAARDFARTGLLCLIGGSADAISYLRYGTFVGAMTGNTVLLGIDIVSWRPDRAIYHLCIIATFLIAVIIARASLLSRMPVAVPLIAGAILLGATELIAGEWSALLAAAALGLQNAAVRKIGGVSINTVFITGDLVELGSAVPQAGEPRRRDEVSLLTAAWIAYAVGAVLGAAALHFVPNPMLVPAILAVVAAIMETRAAASETGH
jgi:uncharacterized membrane protein YoaK (UPF0700 family)